MDKSPDAFRTISEVAEHLETPAHVLRFWESRFPQIRPVKRAGGRRYYRPSDVSLLMGIKRLLHDEGLTIRGVQKILREQGVRHVAGLSGEVLSDDFSAEAAFVDPPVDAVVVTLTSQPKQPPTQGLTDAMAKAVETKPPLVAAKAPVREATVHQSIAGDLAIRQGPWKLIFKTTGVRELYNLADDLSETRNVITNKADVSGEDAWCDRVGDRFADVGDETPHLRQRHLSSLDL